MCDGNPKIFVAEIEHLVVGYVHATKYDLLYANSMVNIMGLAVLEEYRHNGIATKLMDSVEEWAKNIGADTIRLTSGKEREEAHKFYDIVGFERKKVEIGVGYLKTLYVGFKGIHNSSNKLVQNLQGEKYFLTNSFEGLKRDIENLVGEYEQVYMFGLDKALKDSVRIEKCAEKDGERIYTQMQLSGIEECLKNNAIPYSVSHNSTHYLCNEAYFYMLKKMNGHVVFVHIPSTKNLTEEMLQKLVLVFEQKG